MNDDVNRLFDELEDAGIEATVLRRKADRIPLPDDPGAWLDECEQYVSGLPDDLPQKKAIARYIRIARVALNQGRESDLRLFRYKIMLKGNEAQREQAVQRDRRRNEGPKKPRGSRMPDLDKWLDEALERLPEADANELWVRVCAEDDTPDSLFPDATPDQLKALVMWKLAHRVRADMDREPPPNIFENARKVLTDDNDWSHDNYARDTGWGNVPRWGGAMPIGLLAEGGARIDSPKHSAVKVVEKHGTKIRSIGFRAFRERVRRAKERAKQKK